MRKIGFTAVVALAFCTLLAGCDGNSGSVATLPPPPPPTLVWDQDNWDEVLWQ